jgi:predicted aspartyl protease
MMGTFSIRDKLIKVLFDSSSTNSVFNGKTWERLGLEAYSINKTYKITTPGGKVGSHHITRKVRLVIGSKVLILF